MHLPTERKRGFTLLELLVVVIIIGLLAAVALPQFGKALDRSRESEAINVINAGLTAQMAYYQEHGAFTTSSADLSVGFPALKGWTLGDGDGSTNGNWFLHLAEGAWKVELTASSNHGHAASTDHMIWGSINSNGAKQLQHRRPGESAWVDF